MNTVYYIGLDIHNKTISFVIKTHGGQLIRRGTVEATRPALSAWANEIDQPWIGALEATMFSGWVYDLLRSPVSVPDARHRPIGTCCRTGSPVV